MKEEDAQAVVALREELTDTWTKKQIFRTETEMRISVLNDGKHPTQASKYWQSVREQNAMFEALMGLSFDLRRNHIKRMKLERKLENKINEISYKEYKKDENLKQHQKINHSIKEINSMMFKLERIVNQNTKLKTEAGVHNGQYWESTQRRFSKISERMLNVARKIKELSI